MHALRVLICLAAALVFSGQALADTSSGSSTFNGKTVSYTFTGDVVSALSYAEGSTCRVTARVDGETHRIVIREDRLEWNGASVPLDGFDTVRIVMDKTEARFLVDGQEVVVSP
ncbi:hypothetical protein [Desulfoluna spongiiphila]|uniref:DUF5666 domain-containing protein n=1 Tax=Desulfoluna spongiiphila TaxID=419481 RepID=A0A1G5I4G5_9BACT|nr:hypothetical protein [Desulfoluna spongiiphila]SCY70943.1 hypothetical protein SAMN05216233_117110 [Desulfoluna spongiiphila]VVS92729.1 hypothetical protein DBB_22970 [Desulfoluna spongiiphila]